MRTASIVIASCIMACAGSPSLVSALTWHVPSFDVRQLSTNGDELVDFIAKEGIAVLSNIDGLKEAREEALQAALACTYFHQDAITYNNQFSNKNKNEDGSLSVAFPNGVKRVTWATSSANDPFKMTCEGDIEFANKANKLRSIVNNAADSFVAFLDKKVLNPSSDQPLLKASNANGAYKSFRSVVDAGEHLDHLHVYLNKMAEGKHVEMNVEETLELHTDNGLFVAFVPSMRLDFSTAGDVQDGFSIERSDGTEVNLDFPHDGNVLVIMFGDGINWMSKESHKPIRIVPHALGFSKYTFARAWYGRMFLPPKDAIVKEENNFELFSSKARDLLSVVTGEVMGIGCSGSRFRQLHAGHAGSCAHDEMFCWMACRSIANITCTEGTELKCVNSKNGIEWNDSDSHCPTCLPTCFNISQSNSPTLFPTKNPTLNPTKTPSLAPTGTPTNKPTNATSSPTSGAYMITTSGLMAVFTIINFFIMLSA